ncbi:MAG: alanine--tRNA ligase-related protein, partial [Planctomycetota bacterium]
RLFEDAAEAAGKAGATVSGDDAFRLYDTYGFPLDLTELMAKERGLSVDTAGFDRAMAAQKDRSKAGAKGPISGADGPDLALSAEEVAKLRGMSIPETNDNAKFFVGERRPETPSAVREVRATLRAIWHGKNFDENATALGTPRPVGLVFDKTCFYAEMGGQVGDTGRATVTKEAQTGGQPHGGEARIENTRAFGGYVVHEALITRGELRVGDVVSLRVDLRRRRAIEANHTATHLLNFALRDALGDGVDQRGSLVAHDRLRFDFTNNGPAGADALARVETAVNTQIRGDLPVHAELAPLVDARAIVGLRAVFGEQYPDPVRVVSIGAPVGDLLGDPDRETWRGYAIEFCGGTHLPSTGAAAAFIITGEEAVAKGIRRVTAVTGEAAVAAKAAADELAARVEAAVKLSGNKLKDEMQSIAGELDRATVPASRAAEIRSSLAVLQETAKAEAKAAAAARAGEAAKLAERLAEDAANTLDPLYISTIDAGSDIPALQAALKVVANKASRTPVMLLSPDEDAGKVAVVAAVPKDAVAKGLKAGDWVKAAAGEMGGKGGGRPDAAQGSGSDLDKVDNAVTAARAFAAEKLG